MGRRASLCLSCQCVLYKQGGSGNHRKVGNEEVRSMRKWLIGLVVLIIAVFGVLWWLGNSLEQQRPADGEVRMEIDHVF